MPQPHVLFPIVGIKNGVAEGEIHVHCPLRATGNSQACYRLMQFDRTIVEELGGELVVTESQSTSGKSYCKVAIKKKRKVTILIELYCIGFNNKLNQL